MANTLYLECASGISGDMAVAALLDLGADRDVLEKALKSLPVDGFSVEISRVKKSGLDACDFLVRLDADHENHDHDMTYLHGRAGDKTYGCAEEHAHEEMHILQELRHHEHLHETAEQRHHGHSPEVGAPQNRHHEHLHETAEQRHHGHSPEAGAPQNRHHEYSHEAEKRQHHEHPHEHRGLPEILEVIEKADLSGRAAGLAKRIFLILAEAEAKAHGVSLEEVHFHEVGAVDSIVDIVAAAVCLDNLDITEAIIPKLCEGQGTIRCQHGVIPVPVPAVVNIVQSHGLKLHPTDTQGELVTPTGAAVAAAIRTQDRLPEAFTIKRIGVGAGKRSYDRPSLLRAMLIEKEESEKDAEPAEGIGRDEACVNTGKAEQRDSIYKLETNVDDCTGECLGYVMELLFEAGARDVYYMPIFMKKNRPAYQLNVICGRKDVSVMEEIIFRETTTIGIRRTEMERTILERRQVLFSTSLGQAQVKICVLPDGEKRCYPEYASAARIAGEHHISYQEAYRRIEKEAAEQNV